ncbi:MAG: glycosyltransferase family 4 protein [Bacteroidales bacterium]|nr:glycosyltransferase family 4 protein [Bacteroidales bacterium]
MKKVLFINHTNELFGAETVFCQVVDSCLEKNKVYVVEPCYSKQSKFREKIKSLGCSNIQSVSYKNLGGSFIRSFIVLFYNLYAVLKLCRFVRKNKIEIVYSNTSVTCLGVFVAKFTNCDHVWHIHESYSTYYISPSNKFFYELLFGYKKNHFVFISKMQRKEWTIAFSQIRKTNVIYNPIKLIEKKNTQKEVALRYGFVGSFAHRKNILSLLDAFAIICNEDLQYKELLIVDNEGDEYFEVYNRVNNFQNKRGKIILTKEKNVSKIFSQIDILVLPSYSESWGMVVTEAMSVGIATIITKYSGLTEVFKDKKDTVYIDPYDLKSLVSAMRKMAEDSFRQQIVENATKTLEEYNFNNQFVQKVNNLFK